MIIRVWRGWTEDKQSAAYEHLLREEVIPRIIGRGMSEFRGIEVLRRDHGVEVEFMTLMRFESVDAVRDFAGTNFEQASVPPEARALLTRFDGRSHHYEFRATFGR